MSGVVLGGALGLVGGGGVLLATARVRSIRRPSIALRVLPYLRDVHHGDAVPAADLGPVALGRAAVGQIGIRLDRVLGGSHSVQQRLDRANLAITVHEFRIEQALWGVLGFLTAAVPAFLVAVQRPERSITLMILCATAFVVGVLVRENRLTAQVRGRERRVLEELPVTAELLALAVAAGESPAVALDRVVRRSNGEFAVDLARVLAQVHAGEPLSAALDDLAGRSGLPAVSRFAQGIAVAIERGTPLTDVLYAQAADVRDAARRSLIESGARREVLMMVPVVFLILPTVVVFAFWPGLVGLRLVVP